MLRKKMRSLEERVPVHPAITPFRRRVYAALREVPRGYVTTYGALAARIGCASARAVGGALRRNPLAPEVPCHRVVASDLTLGGFAGQRSGEMIEKKRALLKAEGVCFCPKRGEEQPTAGPGRGVCGSAGGDDQQRVDQRSLWRWS